MKIFKTAKYAVVIRKRNTLINSAEDLKKKLSAMLFNNFNDALEYKNSLGLPTPNKSVHLGRYDSGRRAIEFSNSLSSCWYHLDCFKILNKQKKVSSNAK